MIDPFTEPPTIRRIQRTGIEPVGIKHAYPYVGLGRGKSRPVCSADPNHSEFEPPNIVPPVFREVERGGLGRERFGFGLVLRPVGFGQIRSIADVENGPHESFLLLA